MPRHLHPRWRQRLHTQRRATDRAQMLAILPDTLSLQLDRIPPVVRGETVRVSRWLVDERGT
jgi:hypothetical protein